MNSFTLHVIRIHTVNGNTTLVDVIELHKQVNNSRLTSTRWTNDRNLLTWLSKS